MSDYNNPRRYYHRQRMASRVLQDGLEGVWRWKQESQPGTLLPIDFPMRVELAAAGYETREDLDGADPQELLVIAGLSRSFANAVLVAWAQLPPLLLEIVVTP